MTKLQPLMAGIFLMLFTSCLKQSEPYDVAKILALEKEKIEEYKNKHIPNAILHEESGIWYEILDEGEPGSYVYKTLGTGGMLENPEINVKYRVELLNGVSIDQNQTGFKSTLSRMITAWHLVFLPQQVNGEKTNGITPNGLMKGSKIRFVTPSPWAYRDANQGNVPPNSPLYFEVEVLDIKAPDSDNPTNQQ